MKKYTLALAAAALLCAGPARADNADMMASVMGAAAFVSANCPTMQSNGAMIAEMFNRLQVNPDVMKRQPYLGAIISSMNRFEANRAYSCESIWTLLGPEGTTLKGLMVRR